MKFKLFYWAQIWLSNHDLLMRLQLPGKYEIKDTYGLFGLKDILIQKYVCLSNSTEQEQGNKPNCHI